MSSIKKGSTRRSDDTMDDDSDDKDSKRKSRNLSEKKRRDQFNLLVNELSSMVSTGGRKMDKSTVLKSTISFLKSHNETTVRSRINEIQEDWKPTFLTNEEFTHLVLEAVDGFIMVISASGHIYYASESIASLLGHLPIPTSGEEILHLLQPDLHFSITVIRDSLVMALIIPVTQNMEISHRPVRWQEVIHRSILDLWARPRCAIEHRSSDVHNMTIYELASEDEQTNLYNILLSPSEEDKQVIFSCHLRRGGPGPKTSPTYELVHFIGYFRSDEDMIQGDNRYSGYSGEADTRLLFVGTGRLQTPQLIKEMPLVDSIKSEFTSRHSLEWKFLFLDHRAPPIIGYLPFELLGTSGYDYYHVDDLNKVVICHEALMQKGEGTSCYYRFLTKGQQWIWLQTRYYITYHQWNSKPEFIVCTHRVVSYTDVMKQSRKDEQISTPVPDPSYDSSLGAEDSSNMMSGNSSMAMQWSGSNLPHENSSKVPKSVVRQGSPSDCTSMSADSPGSRQSVMTCQRSTKSRPRSTTASIISATPSVCQTTPAHMHQQQIELQPVPQSQPQPQIPTSPYLEPPQYVAAIPVQPLMANFPSSTVLSPLPPVDNLVMSQGHSQLQADLQRKHAELQAIIGQQQQELRRVSEQLLMARLGLLPGAQPQPIVANAPMGYQATNTGIVSSTTSTVQCIPSTMPGTAPVVVPVSVTLSHPLQHQHNIYNSPDSNTQK